MFTPGFKLFGGLATLGLIGAFVYGLSSGDASGPDYFGFVDRNAIIGLISLGWKGNIGAASGFIVLIFMSMTAAFLGGTVVAFRDADVESVAELGDSPSVMPLAQRPTAPSWWPAATALGVGVLLVGLVMETKAFWIVGLAVLAGVAIEWSLTAWADRSTGDARTNAALRDRVVGSFEMPMLALAIGAVIALAVSRILIWAGTNQSGELAVIITGVLSVIILAIALLAVFAPQVKRWVMQTIVGLATVALVAFGVWAQVNTDHHHEEEHGDDHSALSIEVAGE